MPETTYVLARLYAAILTRMADIERVCNDLDKPAVARAAGLGPDDKRSGKERYRLIVNLTTTWVSAGGKLSAEAYEDSVRSVVGNSGYFLFTLDKVVGLFMKTLAKAASSPVDTISAKLALLPSALDLEMGGILTNLDAYLESLGGAGPKRPAMFEVVFDKEKKSMTVKKYPPPTKDKPSLNGEEKREAGIAKV